MAKFIELDPSEITGNVFDRIGKEWMLNRKNTTP